MENKYRKKDTLNNRKSTKRRSVINKEIDLRSEIIKIGKKLLNPNDIIMVELSFKNFFFERQKFNLRLLKGQNQYKKDE